MNSIEQFLAKLASVEGEQFSIDRKAIAEAVDEDAKTYQGIAIKALSIAGGLLASFFLFAFVAMAIRNLHAGLVAFGIITLIVSLVVDKYANNRILDAACIGGYLSGLGMLIEGLDGVTGSDNLKTFVFLSVAVITIIWCRGYILNLFAILLFNGCIYAFGVINHVPYFIHMFTALIGACYVAIQLNEAKFLTAGIHANSRYRAFADAFMVSFVCILLSFAMGITKLGGHNWISSIPIIGLNLVVISQIIGFLHLEKKQALIFFFSLLVLCSAIFAPAICGAILIILISFYSGQKIGLSIGILALIYVVSQFYYDLHYSLLLKSAMLFGTGILFLLARFILIKQLKHGQD